ncbi:MAG: type II toxin-antitoxin system PemK/MazF family toxin [Dehalococcoidia bacterium]
MRRGELFRVRAPGASDPRRSRVFLVVSRQVFIDAAYSSVVCVPAYSQHQGVRTEVSVGPEHGMKQPSWLRCDEVTSLAKDRLNDYVGSLPEGKLLEVDHALIVALGIHPSLRPE